MNNITFTKIIINNFLSIKEVEIDLLERGFIVVSGVNNQSSQKQSNGAGKSSIFDAIFWTLTGETLRGASNVVNENHESEGCMCSLFFYDENNQYVVVRTKSHKEYGNSCRFYVNDELLSDQTKKSQEMINSMIPSVSSPEILGSIVLLGQGLPYRFTSFSPLKRKDLLETMSGSSSNIETVKYRLEVLEGVHKTKLNSLVFECSKIKGAIEGLSETLKMIDSQIQSYKSPEEVVIEIDGIRSTIESLRSSISRIEKESEELKLSKDNYGSIYDRTSEYIVSLKTSRDLIKNQLLNIKSGNCPTCGRPYEVSEENAAKKKLFDEKLKDFENKIQSLVIKLELVKSKIKEIEKDLSDKSVLINGLTSQITGKERDISDLENQTDKRSELSESRSDVDKKIIGYKVDFNDKSKVIEEENEVLECISYLKRQLSRDFKGYVLEEAISFLSSRSEYYSDKLFTTDDKVSVELSGSKILISVGGRLYENLSGGERQRVDLAVQFALRDMLMMTSGFSCNLLILDEAFDNLDSAGSESLVNLIVSQFSDIETIFIITHHSEIDIPYDDEIVVVKGPDGDSTIS